MTVLSNGILAVKVPSDSKDFYVSLRHLCFYSESMPDSDSDGFNFIALPDGNWKLIGIHSADKPLSEEQCKELVEQVEIGWYENYAMNQPTPHPFKSALHSLESWMRANKIYTVNKEDRTYFTDCMEGNCGCISSEMCKMHAWRQVEERTGQWVILHVI
jgi:hypothetical protein